MNNSDFFSKLYEQICENSDSENESAKQCLISNEPLESDCITLYCKHSFNYDALYNEIRQQKYKYVKTEVQRLRYDQIKCPYCRVVQNGLLPYRGEYPKLRNVNHPYKYQMMPNNCIYTFRYGKKKGTACGKSCHKDYCYSCIKKVQRMQTKVIEANVEENVVIGMNCDAILKSGKRAGSKCGKKVKSGCTKCGIHNK
jgi:hypothetical protein